MTEQEIFDTITAHLATMTHPAIGDNGICTYLAPDGGVCAVGKILPMLGLDPDTLAKAQAYQGSASELIYDGGFMFPQWFCFSAGLLDRLQTTHDLWMPRAQMAEDLADAAQDFGLKFDSAAWLASCVPTDEELEARAEAGIDA